MPELEQKNFPKRHIAYKVSILDILNGSFTKDDFLVGYVKVNDNNVSRVNIIATVVHKSEHGSYTNLGIDDGTGRVLLRSFENLAIFSNIDVGDIVLAIGKIREFNNEKYILPEILKKINDITWVNIRKLELKTNPIKMNIESENKKFDGGLITNINEEIFSLIKKLDNGGGALIDDVIKNSNNGDIEKILNELLKNGEVFELTPGKVKVLE